MKQTRREHWWREYTPREEYYIPILESVIELGGRATASQVKEKVEVKMKERFTQADYEPIHGTNIRWRNECDWAIVNLRRRDWCLQPEAQLLRGDAPKGVCEITEKGRQYYKDNTSSVSE